MSSLRSRRNRLSRARVASAGLAALVGLALPGARGLAADALYQWTDERGNTRYTPDPNRIPSGQRASMRRLEPGMPPAIAPARAATEPTQAPARQAEPPLATRAPAPVIAAPSDPAPVEPLAPAAVEPPLAAPATAASASTASIELPDTTAAAVRAPSPVPAPGAAASPTPSSDARPIAPPAVPPTAADATREQELNAAIASDQEKLKTMLAAASIPGETALADSAELREIARRLPELQAELRALRERQTPPAGP